MNVGVSFEGIRFVLLIFTSLIVVGCATPAAVAPPNAAVAPTRPAIIAFTIVGRFSAKNGKEQASGQFRYSQTVGERHLSIYSPLGTPLAEITADATGAALVAANGATQRAESIVHLLRNVIDLPVTDSQLSLWLQGRPSEASVGANAVRERDPLARISRFNESGWDISVSDRFTADDANGNVADAPRRMRWMLSGDPDTEVRWIVDEWKTP